MATRSKKLPIRIHIIEEDHQLIDCLIDCSLEHDNLTAETDKNPLHIPFSKWRIPFHGIRALICLHMPWTLLITHLPAYERPAIVGFKDALVKSDHDSRIIIGRGINDSR